VTQCPQSIKLAEFKKIINDFFLCELTICKSYKSPVKKGFKSGKVENQIYPCPKGSLIFNIFPLGLRVKNVKNQIYPCPKGSLIFNIFPLGLRVKNVKNL